MGVFLALGTRICLYRPLFSGLFRPVSPGAKTAQSHIHIHSCPIDIIGPFGMRWRALRRMKRSMEQLHDGGNSGSSGSFISMKKLRRDSRIFALSSSRARQRRTDSLSSSRASLHCASLFRTFAKPTLRL